MPSSFWSCFEALRDPGLKNALIRLVPDYYHADDGSYDIVGLTSVPLLQSMNTEISRLRMPTPVARSCESSDFQLDDNHTIPRGTRVLMFSHAPALNTEAWAKGRPHTVTRPLNEFWAERFLVPDKKNETSRFSTEGVNGLLTTFGGGHHLCPGRHLAKDVQIGILSVLLNEYEVEFVDLEGVEKLIPSVPVAFGSREPSGRIPVRIRNVVGHE
jgi:cytochrome P450